MKNNIKVLDEINKGAQMGVDAIDFIIVKVKNHKLKRVLDEQKADYEAVIDKTRELYFNYSNNDPQSTNVVEKVMTWYGIEFRTITDESDSKLSELMLQGTNMGIIEGRKILNNKSMDKIIRKLVESFVKLQEDYVEKLKEYL